MNLHLYPFTPKPEEGSLGGQKAGAESAPIHRPRRTMLLTSQRFAPSCRALSVTRDKGSGVSQGPGGGGTGTPVGGFGASVGVAGRGGTCTICTWIKRATRSGGERLFSKILTAGLI